MSEDPRKLLDVVAGQKRLMMTLVDDRVCVGVYSQEPGDDAETGEFIDLERAHWPLLGIAVSNLTAGDDPLPKFEPATCATRHLLAERAVRIIEGFARNGGRLDTETLSSIEQLVDDAGVKMAREALSPDVPF